MLVIIVSAHCPSECFFYYLLIDEDVAYRSNMEMSGYMSDYICSFTNISGYAIAHIICPLMSQHMYSLRFVDR